ncbi:O-succinylbenzoic acid-CoA ligase [Flavobacteriaceae bacterium 3519-10]|nr:O-succinylbenzoic acid-CoA ligase [Flavobacteriaceae bacterium 3519-10]
MTLSFSENIDPSLLPQTEFEEKVVSFLEEWHSVRETVPVQTSGSTGTPKVFAIRKERMRHSANMTCDFLNLSPESSALLCLPVEYISGKMMVVRAAERNMKLTVSTPTSQPLQNITEFIDFCAMTPLQVQNSLDKIHLIGNLIIGGAQVAEHLKVNITDALKHSNTQSRVYETYGMSETLSHIALKQIYPKSEEFFTVLGDVQISQDERSCLSVFAPKLNPDRLQTNDLVEIKNATQFRFIGRLDNIINSGGLKIHPEELEELVKKHLKTEVIFAGLKDDRLGQKLVLGVEGARSTQLSNALNTALDAVETAFSKNHRPREIFYLNEFPRLPNGKISRRALIELL